MKNFNLKRVWVEASLHKDAIIKLTLKSQIHHLNTVLKIKPTENIRLFNQVNGEWLGQIQEINKKTITISIKEQLRKAEHNNDIAIAFAPIKQDRLRFLIEKCTELGVNTFIPIITERTVIRTVNATKLKNYALGATEQSERLSIPVIKDIISLKTFLKEYINYKILFCSERSNADFLSKTLQKLQISKKIIILIGPEGGFSATEQKSLANHQNIFPVSLGKNILRTETATIFAVSCYIIAQNL
ncbi:MAG: 16S rRNA (uracil(1498)-N(3))-methyltransferase [Rickettsiales bacterium]|nr:16S rRNA (uracil(1498)-N(3))-methyltransferase [Rickettsiales bacterium]